MRKVVSAIFCTGAAMLGPHASAAQPRVPSVKPFSDLESIDNYYVTADEVNLDEENLVFILARKSLERRCPAMGQSHRIFTPDVQLHVTVNYNEAAQGSIESDFDTPYTVTVKSMFQGMELKTRTRGFQGSPNWTTVEDGAENPITICKLGIK